MILVLFIWIDPFRMRVMSLLEDGGLIDNNQFISEMKRYDWSENESGMNETIKFWIEQGNHIIFISYIITN